MVGSRVLKEGEGEQSKMNYRGQSSLTGAYDSKSIIVGIRCRRPKTSVERENVYYYWGFQFRFIKGLVLVATHLAVFLLSELKIPTSNHKAHKSHTNVTYEH